MGSHFVVKTFWKQSQPSKMNSVVGSRLAPVSRRFFSTGRILRNAGEPTEVHPGYKVIKEKQKLFQEVNGLSIRQRGGSKDVMRFRITQGLCAAVILHIGSVWYKMAMKGR